MLTMGSRRGVLLISALLLVAALPFAGHAVIPGLDPSYFFALNWLFLHGRPGADDLLFSYGPLGMLCHPQPMGHNLVIANLLRGMVAAAFVWFFLQLSLVSRRRGPEDGTGRGRAAQVGRLVFALAGANVILHLPFLYLLFGLTLLALLLNRSTGRAEYLTLALICPALAFVIKPGFWILCLSLSLSHALLVAMARRKASFLAAALGWSGLALATFWLAAGGTLTGLVRQLRAQWELAVGNSAAMTLPSDIGWVLVLPAGLLLIGALMLLKPGRSLLAALILPTLAWAKYALGRPDHAYHLHHLALLLAVIFLAGAGAGKGGRPGRGQQWWVAFAMVAVALIGLHLGIRSVGGVGVQTTSPLALLSHAVEPTGLLDMGKRLSPGGEARRLEQGARPAMDEVRLGRRVLNRIGTRTVDVYPWNLALIHANRLAWAPRPVLQSYIAYTPWLDAQNAAHLASPRAPAFMLWEVNKQLGPIMSIDLRYLLSDEPRTMMEVVRRYRLCDAGKKVALLRRRPVPLSLETRVLERRQIQWNSWVKVPRVQGAMVRARLHHGVTLRGALLRAVSQDRFILLRYRFSDGAVRTHRVVPGAAQSGLWISPYLDHHFFEPPLAVAGRACPLTREWFEGNRPTEIRLVPSDMNAVAPNLALTWEIFTPAP